MNALVPDQPSSEQAVKRRPEGLPLADGAYDFHREAGATAMGLCLENKVRADSNRNESYGYKEIEVMRTR